MPDPIPDWKHWLLQVFPNHFVDPQGVHKGFSDYHEEFWEWMAAIRSGLECDPFVSIWPRDSGKSTDSEIGAVLVGHRRVRKYAWYISGSQDQADDHVQNISSLLENDILEEIDPKLCERSCNKYGQAKGWRRNRLVTDAGFVVDALGLNTAARGVKFGHQRPDFMIFDDIDDDTDSGIMVEKKIRLLTRKLIPAGSKDCILLFVQNLVHPNSIFSRFVDGRADFLTHRQVSGPHPAIEDLTYVRGEKPGQHILTGGNPTWEGLDIPRCQAIVDKIGIKSFLVEHQHEIGLLGGPYFTNFDEDQLTMTAAEIGIPDWAVRWISIDWGFSHNSAVYWYTRLKDDWGEPVTYVYREFVQNLLTPEDLATCIATRTQLPNGMMEPIDLIYLSPDACANRDGVSIPVKQQLDEALVREGLPMTTPASNDRIGGAQQVYKQFDNATLIIAKECENLIMLLPNLMHDPNRPNDVEPIVGADDEWDSLRYGVHSRLKAKETPVLERMKQKAIELTPTQYAFYSARMEKKLLKQNSPVRIYRGRRRKGKKWIM